MDSIEEYKYSRQLLFDTEGIQPTSNIISVKGPVKKIHYLEMGSGDPLVLVHGGGSHADEWFNILKPLSQHFHLYIVDRPGCGLSGFFDYKGVNLQEHAVSFLKTFLDGLKIQQANILAQSMGGYFSLCFALQHPERVKKLLLIGAPAGINRWIPTKLRLLGIPMLNSWLSKTLAKPSLKNVVDIHRQILVADVSQLSNLYLTHAYHSQLLPGAWQSFQTLLANVLTIKGWKTKYYLGDQLHHLRVPTGLIWGEKDAFENPDSGFEKMQTIRQYQFERVENAGHCPWLDQPEKCTELILQML